MSDKEIPLPDIPGAGKVRVTLEPANERPKWLPDKEFYASKVALEKENERLRNEVLNYEIAFDALTGPRRVLLDENVRLRDTLADALSGWDADAGKRIAELEALLTLCVPYIEDAALNASQGEQGTPTMLLERLLKESGE